MDQFHERLTRVGLAAVEPFGFCLAGGYAVAAHGFVERPSEDVDLFTTVDAARDLPQAVQAAERALDRDGLTAEVTLETATFARIVVTDPSGDRRATLELAVDWRAHSPTRLNVGAVLHPDDTVANKVCALFGRAEVRDYVDVDGILRSGRYDLDDLVELAARHDPGFDVATFADALARVERLPDSAFTRYGLDSAQACALRDRLVACAQKIRTGGPP